MERWQFVLVEDSRVYILQSIRSSSLLEVSLRDEPYIGGNVGSGVFSAFSRDGYVYTRVRLRIRAAFKIVCGCFLSQFLRGSGSSGWFGITRP